MKKNPDTTTLLLIAGLAAAGVYFYLQSQKPKKTSDVKTATKQGGVKTDAAGNILDKAGKVIATAKEAESVLKQVGGDIAAFAKMFGGSGGDSSAPSAPAAPSYDDSYANAPENYTQLTAQDFDTSTANYGPSSSDYGGADTDAMYDAADSDVAGLISRGMGSYASAAAAMPRRYGYASYKTVNSAVRGMYDMDDDNCNGRL